MKFDFKKDLKAEFNATKTPKQLHVSAHHYLMIDGTGNPNSDDFADHIAALYSVAYPIKMRFKKTPNLHTTDYDDYVVPPLTGDWTISDDAIARGSWTKDDFVYTLRILIPDFVPLDFASTVLNDVQTQKQNDLLDTVRLAERPARQVVQALHVGPYDDEPATFAKMDAYMVEKGLRRTTKNHTEVYLGDARRTAPEKLKTVLEVPVQ